MNPSLRVDRDDHYDGYRHRAILDLGAELFDHLSELNGVNGEYVLHILEATGARLESLPFLLPSSSLVLQNKIH